jgi:hypothetical protein
MLVGVLVGAVLTVVQPVGASPNRPDANQFPRHIWTDMARHTISA